MMAEFFLHYYYMAKSWLFNHVNRYDRKYQGFLYEDNVSISDQAANDVVFDILSHNNPCLIAKLGTNELDILAKYRRCITDNKYSSTSFSREMFRLTSAAGFFPCDESLIPDFYNLYVRSLRNVDVLGSYQKNEELFDEELNNAIRVNLDGYYAPFYWLRPWTRCLKGKKVLVVHPFVDEIKFQYARRQKIWRNNDLLPEFELKTYRAVQTILGQPSLYSTWFDALESMKNDITNIDFDIALIGCGAYGLPLASHIKDLGKQAVHLAGWTQVLFGIIGKRWENNVRVSVMMNKYWIHPYEIPKNAKDVENGCYW